MTRFTVDADAVMTATTATQATIGRLQSEVANLQSQLANLQSSWTGQAAVAFQTLLSDWSTTQVRVEQNLQAIASALGNAGHQYAEIEQQNARLFLR